jgi:hypothetical protein
MVWPLARPWSTRMPAPEGWPPQRHVAALRQEVGLRVFGVQAHLDGMALQPNLVLRQRQRFAARHGNCQAHQVLAGDAFR